MPARLHYSDAVESPIEDEEQIHRKLIDAMRSITETTSKDYGHAVRSVHAKAHGIPSGELEIAADLPPELSQGLFAAPRKHRVLMRFSTSPGDILDDAVSAPRGLALKILDVAGERLPDARHRRFSRGVKPVIRLPALQSSREDSRTPVSGHLNTSRTGHASPPINLAAK